MVIKFSPRAACCWCSGASRSPRTRRPAARASQAAAPRENGRFRQVTDVAFDPPQSLHQRRVHQLARRKVDRNGNWVNRGLIGNKPGESTRRIDRRRRQGQHLRRRRAATRRVQVFDGEGTFLREFTIDVPYDAKARPAIGNLPDAAKIEASGNPKTMMPGNASEA